MKKYYTLKERNIARDRLSNSLFDKRKNGNFKTMKPSIYKKMLDGLRKRRQENLELKNKVQAEMDCYLENVVLPKYNINKKWYIIIHTQKRR